MRVIADLEESIEFATDAAAEAEFPVQGPVKKQAGALPDQQMVSASHLKTN
jgi:hypothetical protein